MNPMNLIPTNTGELGFGGLANIHQQNFAQWAKSQVNRFISVSRYEIQRFHLRTPTSWLTEVLGTCDIVRYQDVMLMLNVLTIENFLRSTMGNAPENVSYHRVRSETYHGPLHELSDTDYAVSISRLYYTQLEYCRVTKTKFISVRVKQRMNSINTL